MSPSAAQLATLVAAWALYGSIHSLLASFTAKEFVARRWPAAAHAYRLTFNAVAALLLVPPAWLTFALRGPLLWEWSGIGAWLANAVALGALAGFLWTTRHYDMDSFSGLAQWRTRTHSPADQEGRLHLSPLHRIVRHPWYFLGLLILWTRDMDAARLTSSLCITAYLWIGSLLEERKLLALHGARYARYRAAVAGLIPLPGRILTRAQARALLAEGDSPAGNKALRNGGGGV
ncbi:methyltransferase family protein [Aromatoleum petrolei]|uniref:Methanethiol S-methyltransferase n=1 Tax=Aromatoleum petrolei TaxID=76116 RepID=A0ABX1MXT9_9RHOO|nr:hypothetical protein [Aromatoleum petrolei]NMF91155.1 hypothetical protein [Aromatoleum petrolei]QTQ37611.1 Uncharacterized protein ToN1_34940 [Aromatoleum petrolei]